MSGFRGLILHCGKNSIKYMEIAGIMNVWLENMSDIGHPDASERDVDRILCLIPVEESDLRSTCQLLGADVITLF